MNQMPFGFGKQGTESRYLSDIVFVMYAMREHYILYVCTSSLLPIASITPSPLSSRCNHMYVCMISYALIFNLGPEHRDRRALSRQ